MNQVTATALLTAAPPIAGATLFADAFARAFEALLREPPRRADLRLPITLVLPGARFLTHAPRYLVLDGSTPLGEGQLVPGCYRDGAVAVRDSMPRRGLTAQYFAGRDFETSLWSQVDQSVNLYWYKPNAPAPARLPNDEDVSVTWTGFLSPRADEVYTLRTESDDGVRLWLDERLVIDNWTLHATTRNEVSVALRANHWYPLRIEYFQGAQLAKMRLSWSRPGQAFQLIPPDCLVTTQASLSPPHGWRSGAPLPEPVGEFVLGEQPVTDSEEELGRPLLASTAHRFSVLYPAWLAPTEADRERVRLQIEAMKPAHTSFDLCFVEPGTRVGLQARLGLDSYVAESPPQAQSDATRLDFDSYLAPASALPGISVGTERVGINTRL